MDTTTTVPPQDKCPHCGACLHCGQKQPVYIPYIQPVPQQPSPWWQIPQWSYTPTATAGGPA